MYPVDFDYVAPASLEEALGILADEPGARPLAGGQSLVPLLKQRLADVERLVDLGQLAGELSYVREREGEVVVGALTPHAELAAPGRLAGAGRALAEAAAAVGDLQVRNLGTLGGSLAHADPSADLPAAVLALDATLVVRSTEGERSLPATEFFRGLWTTALEPGELLVEVRFATDGSTGGGSGGDGPDGEVTGGGSAGGGGVGRGGAYEKLAHPASGFALVGVAAAVTLSAGRFERVRLGVTGVGNRPERLAGVEEALAGVEVDGQVVREACQGAGAAVESAQDDRQASADYRRAMTDVLARRALLRAAKAAERGAAADH